jgi:hypothetical protein
MIAYTNQLLADLKDKPRIFYVLKFVINATTYRFTNADTVKVIGGETYIPGFLDEMEEIEITSEPRTNDNGIVFSDPDRAITTAFLSGKWMNKTCSIIKVFENKNGVQILSKNAFEGLISDYSIDYEGSTVEATVSSIWADFEKQSGIKTNPKSQQRFYPNDTAFEHSAKATNKVYWGKDAPAGTGGGAGIPAGSKFPTPRALN